jgi:hypothetical protein
MVILITEYLPEEGAVKVGRKRKSKSTKDIEGEWGISSTQGVVALKE